MKRIAGVSLWIWAVGLLVLAGGVVAVLPFLAGDNAGVSAAADPGRKLSARDVSERAARAYFEAIKAVQKASKNGLGAGEIPVGTPLGDAIEIQKKIDLEKAELERIHGARKAAEAELERAETAFSDGHLRALRNWWGATFRENALPLEQKRPSAMTFEEAVSFGKSLSGLPPGE